MKTKKKFITIRPKTMEAEEYFERYMMGLQSCGLLEQNKTAYKLKPIRAYQTFWVQMSDDKNWEIEKWCHFLNWPLSTPEMDHLG